MTKFCPRCEKHKPHSEFYKRGDGLQANCKVCKSEVDRQYNIDSNKKRERKKERQQELKEWVASYKAEKGCAYCPERDSLFLDFHHANDDKEFTIADIQRRSLKVIQKEIGKCIVVCCKCHRMIHAGRSGPWNTCPSRRTEPMVLTSA